MLANNITCEQSSNVFLRWVGSRERWAEGFKPRRRRRGASSDRRHVRLLALAAYIIGTGIVALLVLTGFDRFHGVDFVGSDGRSRHRNLGN